MDEPAQLEIDNGDENEMPTLIIDDKSLSIAERRAAKCGFNAERIHTAAGPVGSSSCSPAALSPCLTIPPGISPTALLDSPVMLPNSQLSPTTGTFLLPPFNHESSLSNTLNPADEDRCGSSGSFFRFKPHGMPDSLPDFSSSEDKVRSPSNIAQKADIDYQALFTLDLPMDFEFSVEVPKENTANTIDSVNGAKVSNSMIVNDKRGILQLHCSDRDGDLTSLHKPIHGEDVGMHHLSEVDQKSTNPSLEVVNTSEDVYNWRKYGQKQVKGSEHPRSYYKCTHPNCLVTKKVERSYDGQITKIIYKGAHNHPEPQPSRRPLLGSAIPFDEMSERSEGKVEDRKDDKPGSDWHADGHERTSSASVITELSDPLSPTHVKSFGTFDSSDTPELSSTLASHDDNDDGGTQGGILHGDDANDNELQYKRRKMENSLLETNLASRAVREPRVVVQIESELDILDDGYRWRKYGQKVVKGNPNPRSYYKCTSAGCLVRKHVERASHNLKCVITTYEGKHNHEVPAAKNSSNVNSSVNNLLPAVGNAQTGLTLPRNTYAAKPEQQIQDMAPCFERKPEFNNEYLRPGLIGNFSSDMKFGIPSIYLMKFPPLQNPYGSFGLNTNRGLTHQSGSINTAVPDFPFSLPWVFPSSSNLSLPGCDFNNSNGKPVGPVQSFLSRQPVKETDTRFLRPKQEQKDDTLHDACMPIVDNTSSSSSSSVYHQVIGNFPS
ncbi:WRKY transcription factor SUSIBA2-like isoform X2 [Mangifera indica]|uniref:WRKY transcription factor SUSIBA2-like isoform X2 n=1 Tax=Mangifera indica TaxID=29780 RepID=UPI001CFBDA32|nr:WRKY transcription factor SUSIBA2-like isoform X2 [Mangifera indica]